MEGVDLPKITLSLSLSLEGCDCNFCKVRCRWCGKGFGILEQWLPEVIGGEREERKSQRLRSFGEVAHGVAVGFQLSKSYRLCLPSGHFVVESPTVFIFNLIKEK